MKKFIVYSFLIIGLFLFSCKKFLDVKPVSNIKIPTGIQDLQALLDNYALINGNQYPATSELMADNYYLPYDTWNSFPDLIQKDLYGWQANANTSEFWQAPYVPILTCNIVLEEMDQLKKGPADAEAWKNVRGSALFIRSSFFYALAQLFCNPHEKNGNNQSPGIILRESSDYNVTARRASVEETYNRIITDLKEASGLLPVVPTLKSRPGKPAVYGALARTYLAMQEYDSAGVYADKCLKLYSDLMDYNSLNANATAPIQQFNKEVIFQMRGRQATIMAPARIRVDSNLYNSYDVNDLRKTVFFRSNGNGSYRFKGDYDGSGTTTGYVFGGIVTDEIYLIRAESNARAGKITEAMADLNTLLKTRWKNTVTYMPVTASTVQDAVRKIINERRKELLNRGTRWTDLRRLRNEAPYAVVPKRVFNGQVYELQPNSPRYNLLIPINEINLSGIEQNP